MIEDVALDSADQDPAHQANLFACRGLALEALGSTREAIYVLERALSMDPALKMAQDGIARLRGDANEVAA